LASSSPTSPREKEGTPLRHLHYMKYLFFLRGREERKWGPPQFHRERKGREPLNPSAFLIRREGRGGERDSTIFLRKKAARISTRLARGKKGGDSYHRRKQPSLTDTQAKARSALVMSAISTDTRRRALVSFYVTGRGGTPIELPSGSRSTLFVPKEKKRGPYPSSGRGGGGGNQPRLLLPITKKKNPRGAIAGEDQPAETSSLRKFSFEGGGKKGESPEEGKKKHK